MHSQIFQTLHNVGKKVHIKVNSDHVQNHDTFHYVMLEKMLQANYNGVKITKDVNEYGLLTDIWIEFKDISHVTQFKLSWQSQ